jgi:hypothetical protein
MQFPEMCAGNIVPSSPCRTGFDAMVKIREAWKLTTKNYWNRAYGGRPKAGKEVQQLPTCISPLFPRGVDAFEFRRVNCKGCHTAFLATVFATHPAFQFHATPERGCRGGKANP